MSVGSRTEKFNIVSNDYDHGRTQKCNFCVIYKFSLSSFASPRLLRHIEEFGANKCFTDYHTPSKQHKIVKCTTLPYDMHAKMSSNIPFLRIQAMEEIRCNGRMGRLALLILIQIVWYIDYSIAEKWLNQHLHQNK